MVSLEEQYRNFLTLNNVKEESLPNRDRALLKRAFMAGCGFMLEVVVNQVGQLDDPEEASSQLYGLMKQSDDFWEGQP